MHDAPHHHQPSNDVQYNIDHFGQHIIGVFPDEDTREVGFYYTIGNSLRGLPELLMIGSFEPQLGGLIMNTLGDHMRRSEHTLPEGLLHLPDWPYPFKIRKAGPKAKRDYTIQASRYFRHEDYKVLQIMICDPQGRFSGDPGCDKPYDVAQP